MVAFLKREADVLAFGLLPAHRKYELRQARYTEMIPDLGNHLRELGPGAQALDVGCGWGDTKRVLAAVAPAVEWTGVDRNPDCAATCRQNGYIRVIDDLDLEKASLPFGDETFDVVVASHVLEHLENAAEALSDWHRVLKPGGLMLVGVPMHMVWVAWIMRLRYWIRGRDPYAHCVFFSMPSLRRLLKGYDVRRIWGFRFFSARKVLPLEDWEWFYRLSMWVGERFPNITQEVNILISKPAPNDL